MTAGAADSPLSFDVDVRRLPSRGFPVAIAADDEARAALAAAHGLEAVDSFAAELLVERWGRDGVKVTGRIRAAIVQACVVTLEPVPATIDVPVEAVFLPETSKLWTGAGGEILIDPDGPDAPESFAGDTVDVGVLAEEFFELAIDPYPRAPGAALAEPAGGDAEEGAFSALSQLKGKP